MSKTSSLIAFMLGMAVGSAATWQIVRQRYQKQAEEEIASVKEFYQSKQVSKPAVPDDSEAEAAARMNREKPSVADYAKLLQKQGYTNYSNATAEEEKPEEEPEDGHDPELPYVISPDDFGEKPGYDQISLTYFEDGVLVDEADDMTEIEDVEQIVGDALNHFGEYEEDAVFVRNDAKKCDYEILKDLRRFCDVLEDLGRR